MTAHAHARETVRTEVVATATARVPVRVTVQASGPSGTVRVTRSGVLAARVRATERVEVTQMAPGAARRCVAGPSRGGARTIALRQAYARALAEAHAHAAKVAARALRALARREYPAVLAKARADAAARATRMALQARSELTAQARARARTLAADGG